MAKQQPRTFSADFKQFFGRGLAILLPSVLTLWLLWSAAVFVFNKVAVPINGGLRGAIIWVAPRVLTEDRLPAVLQVTDVQLAEYRRQQTAAGRGPVNESILRTELRRLNLRQFWDSQWYLAGAGLVVAIVLIYFAGLLLGGIVGRRLYGRVETLISRIPGFKQIYPHVKQLVELVIGEKPLAFKRVVLVEFPRKDSWVMGFVTAAGLRGIQHKMPGEMLTVFIPNTPTPFTGFTINVPAGEVVDLPISIDEAIRFILTGGVLLPESQSVAPLDPAMKELAERMAAAGPRPRPPG